MVNRRLKRLKFQNKPRIYNNNNNNKLHKSKIQILIKIKFNYKRQNTK